MDGKSQDSSLSTVVDWLEVRFKDELKSVERRQQALVTELRIYLGTVACPIQVTPPEVASGPGTPSLPAHGLLRPPDEGNWVTQNASSLDSQTSVGSRFTQDMKDLFFVVALLFFPRII